MLLSSILGLVKYNRDKKNAHLLKCAFPDKEYVDKQVLNSKFFFRFGNF